MMLRCSPEAFAQCPTRALCGNVQEATFTEDSECAKFNRRISDKPMTNADRIRAMSDDGLETFIRNVAILFEPWCDNHCKMDGDDDCNKCLAKWLRQPAAEGVNG